MVEVEKEQWQCSTGSKYPFYVIKEENMAIIPIHDEDDLVGRLGREGILYESGGLTSSEPFSLYHPSGPSITKASK